MSKKKTRSLFVIIFCAFTMTSCINFIESIFFNKDGSGTYSMTVDMSELGALMGGLGESDAPSEFDDLEKDFEKKAQRMEQIEGISNVRHDGDMKSFKVSLLFDFKDVDALNRGMSEYFHSDDDGPMTKQYIFFTKDKRQITRTSQNLILDALKGEIGGEGDEEPIMDPSILFGDMYYEMRIGFEKDIKSISNEDYIVGDGLNWEKGNLRWRKYLFKKEDEKSPEVTIVTKR